MHSSWEDLPHAGSLAIAAASLLIAILIAQKLCSLQLSRPDNKQTLNDPYQITKCPNPNCARCSKYVELNRSAQRRLPWIAKGENLARLRRAIATGPDVADADDESSSASNSGQAAAETTSPVAGQRPNVLLVRGLKTRPIVTDLHHNACRILEDLGNHVLLNEYRNAMESHSVTALENDVRTGTWRVLHLLNQGCWIQSNANLCPKTTEAVQSTQGIMEGCIFGNIFISVLFPGTIVDPHCGPTNVRHRLHFPLLVPKCASLLQLRSEPELRVATERITWTEGECFVFDDSIVHSASYPRNESDETSLVHRGNENDSHSLSCRVVLILDLWHPDLSADERNAISELYPAAT